MDKRNFIQTALAFPFFPHAALATSGKEPASLDSASFQRQLLVGHAGHGKTTLAAALGRHLGQDTTVAKIHAEQQKNIKSHQVSCSPVVLSVENKKRLLADCDQSTDLQRIASDKAMTFQAAVLVVSASEGPMPGTREHIAFLDHLGIPIQSVFLNKIDQVDDRELQELVELEVRELLSSYNFDGKNLPVIHGSALAAVNGLDKQIGYARVASLLGTLF